MPSNKTAKTSPSNPRLMVETGIQWPVYAPSRTPSNCNLWHNYIFIQIITREARRTNDDAQCTGAASTTSGLVWNLFNSRISRSFSLNLRIDSETSPYALAFLPMLERHNINRSLAENPRPLSTSHRRIGYTANRGVEKFCNAVYLTFFYSVFFYFNHDERQCPKAARTPPSQPRHPPHPPPPLRGFHLSTSTLSNAVQHIP